MKKIIMIILLTISIIIITFFSMSYNKKNVEPQTYYKIYLNGQILGIINSKEELENYINIEQEHIKKIYNVDDVHIPNGIEVKKEIGYKTNYNSVEEIYKLIKEKSDFTIKGYQISIHGSEEIIKIYVLDQGVFKESVENVIKTYVGTEKYEKYKNNNQDIVKETGAYIQDVYVNNEITIKETNIPVSETIYTDSKALSKYLLFGNSSIQKMYTVNVGDTVEQVAYDNEISVEEFLMSNPKYKKSTNILSVGEEVVIAMTDPKIDVTVIQENTQDIEQMYKTIEKMDSTIVVGYESISQKGQNGINRIKQNEKIVNGTIVYVQPISNETLRASVDQIVLIGAKKVPEVGGLRNWFWPSESYYISSPFAYRKNPFTGKRELHGAIDIAAAYGSKVYAANNGVVITMSNDSVNGIHVVINHNNGYYTWYNHMSRFASNLRVGQIVEAGQLIGHIGMTGSATGPHLHFAVWYGKPFTSSAYRVDPKTLYPQIRFNR